MPLTLKTYIHTYIHFEFSTAIQLRLGLNIPLIPSQHCICGARPDPFGNHFLNCRRGGEVIYRHNAIRQVMSAILKSSGDVVYQEIPINSFPVDGASDSSTAPNLRFDIVAMSRAFLQNISADVTVSNPLSSSAAILLQNANTNGNSNNRAESRKNAMYAQVSHARGLKFTPLAVETFGRLGKSFRKCLKEAASRVIASSAEVDQIVANKLHATLVHLWQMKISCVLQKGNARIIQMAISRILSRNHQSPNLNNLDFSVLQERLLR